MPVDDLEQVIAAAEAEVAELAVQRAAAAERLAALRQRRSRDSSGSDEAAATSSDWSPMRKVEIFRSLFRGREEIFAVRWEKAAKQKAGYAPSCANEWKHGVCEKPRVRCGACPNQAFLAADSQAVLAHLQGREVMGIYPLLPDETCWLLAIDLDGESGRLTRRRWESFRRSSGFLQRSSAHDPERVRTCGSSSPRLCQRRGRALSGPCC